MNEWPDRAATTVLAELTTHLEQALPNAAALRRELHRHPDLSGHERPTADRLRHALPTLKPTRVADTGFLVRVGPPGPSVVVRAELDGLPVEETSGLPWAATDGVMHACGHDVHLAGLWALLQAARRVELPVGLVGLFQPREEVQPSGAESVVSSGVLDDHQVAAVIGAHVQPRVAAGIVSTGNGAVNAAADRFEIIIHGEPGHGAYPHLTIDPVPVLAAVISGLQELVARGIDPLHPAVITVGRVEAGTAANVIPATARLEGVIRTMSEADRTHLHGAVRRLAELTAAARGARAEVSIVIGDPVLVNDRRLVHLTDPLIGHLGLALAHEPFRSCGADDFSHYGELAPILMMFIGVQQDPTVRIAPAATSGVRHEIGLHHPDFVPAENAIRDLAVSLASGYVAGAQLARSLA